jgi:probable addiction module antidote protein
METSKFDIADYLDNNEMIAEYLKEVLKEGDNAQLVAAIGYIEKAVQEGIDSGIAHDFNPEKHLQELKSKRRTSQIN